MSENLNTGTDELLCNIDPACGHDHLEPPRET